MVDHWLAGGESGASVAKMVAFSTSLQKIAVALVVLTAGFPGKPGYAGAVHGLIQLV